MSNNRTDSNKKTRNLIAMKLPDAWSPTVRSRNLEMSATGANAANNSVLVGSTRASEPVTAGDTDAATVVDLNSLRSLEDAQLDGEADLIVELIDLYLEDAPGRVQSIAEAIANRDTKSLKRSAHILKGSSGSLGVLHLITICEKLEEVANHDSFADAATLLGNLEREFSRVSQVLLAERAARA